MFSKQGGWILFYTGFIFGGFYAQIAVRTPLALKCPIRAQQTLTVVTQTILTIFAHNFKFDPFQIGLCYIPFGFGWVIAALFTGKTMDSNFRRLAKQLNHPITAEKQNDLSNFPMEKATIHIVIPLVCLGFVTAIVYGWVLQTTKSLARPLILLFFLGFSLCGAYSAFSTLMVDISP
jgi:MFS family permease